MSDWGGHHRPRDGAGVPPGATSARVQIDCNWQRRPCLSRVNSARKIAALQSYSPRAAKSNTSRNGCQRPISLSLGATANKLASAKLRRGICSVDAGMTAVHYRKAERLQEPLFADHAAIALAIARRATAHPSLGRTPTRYASIGSSNSLRRIGGGSGIGGSPPGFVGSAGRGTRTDC